MRVRVRVHVDAHVDVHVDVDVRGVHAAFSYTAKLARAHMEIDKHAMSLKTHPASPEFALTFVFVSYNTHTHTHTHIPPT